jgi:hypothetical protein
MSTTLTFVFFAALTLTARALQFLRVSQTKGNDGYDGILGIDFTVYAEIDVTAVGLIDTDDRGINGTLTAYIVSRSNASFIVGSVSVNASRERSDERNPFVFVDVSIRLEPGVYTLVSTRFSAHDRFIRQGVDLVDTPAVVVTGSVWGAPTPSNVDTDIYASATFVFQVVTNRGSGAFLAQRRFDDCEAVACAGLGSGFYNVGGVARYCDNDADGGGWVRLWRANESTCESNGWSSSRNRKADGIDPGGCRPTSTSCSGVPTERASFPFQQVRAANWAVWALGSLDAFNADQRDGRLCDGVTIRDGSNKVVLVLAAGGSPSADSHCPCDKEFESVNPTNRARYNVNDSEPLWACDRPLSRDGWRLLFAGNSTCASQQRKGDVRTLSSPQNFLRISLCIDQDQDDEDLKLAGGDCLCGAPWGFVHLQIVKRRRCKRLQRAMV